MGRFSEVTTVQAEKILSEVEFENHLQASRINPMSGGLPIFITSLQEAEEFLFVSDFQGLKVHGGGGFVTFMDFNKLKTWVAEVVEDQELADAIGEEIDKGTCFADTIGPIKEVMAERIMQCKEVLGITEEEEEPKSAENV